MSSWPTEQRSRAGGADLVDVTMPQLGVSVAEGALVEWRKQPGEPVQADETICEISTDKIDSEVPSPATGRLAEVLVEVGAVVPVGTTLARIATDMSAPADTNAGVQTGQDAEASRAQESAADGARESAAVHLSGSPGNGAAGAHRPPYSPVVQRIAAERGIDLSQVRGSGRGGRVRKQDVLAALEETGFRAHTGEPARAAASRASAPGAGTPEAGEPLSRARQAIAEHMVRSLRTAAHCTTIIEVDMSRIDLARRRLELTYLPFVARGLVETLREFPQMNATLEDGMLTRHRSVNLGIAVSLGERGLIVPVIRDAHELSVEGLATRIAELARRARASELVPDDVRGGTFTLTNPGAHGTVAATPIINQPQVAILDFESVIKRALVVSDARGADAVAIRPVTNLCLSWDHRALDGELAARFLAALRGRLEEV